jgi:hypothetical protein
MCSTMRTTAKNKTRKNAQIKFYKTVAMSELTLGSEI